MAWPRRVRSGLAGAGLAAVVLWGAGGALAQGGPELQGRLLQRSDGTAYVYRDGFKALLRPAPLADEEIDAIPDAPDADRADPTPALPDPVAVTLPVATTAYLVLDIQPTNCGRRPACLESVPRIAALLERARAAGVSVLHAGTTFLPEVEPVEGEPVVATSANKFFRTELDDHLRARGATTLLMVGTASNGAIMYTAFEAVQRGYTVVVADDGISADTPYVDRYVRVQLLNQPGGANPTNQPLAPGVTLTRTDLVAFE